LKELNAPVEYIILPTFAYEHKIFVGPFSRKFPRAQIWVAPRQWSWPINLPLEFFGIFHAKYLKDEDDSTPWYDEIEQKVLSSPEVGIYLFLFLLCNQSSISGHLYGFLEVIVYSQFLNHNFIKNLYLLLPRFSIVLLLSGVALL
jgi:Domain of unknown function (DUF4336)